MITNLSALTNEVITIVKEVGNFIRTERQQFNYEHVEVKGLNDLVSYVDKTSEKLLVEKLEALYPEAGFIVEENTKSERKLSNWIIDPLDGTTNFVHGVPSYAISVALEHNGEIIIGVVYEVSQDQCFYAFSNGGAYLNGEKITVSTRHKLSESLIATGFPIQNFSRIEPFIKSLTYFMQHTHGVRRLGAAAVDLCYLACGKFEAFYEYNLNAWDVAAGALIVIESGGTITDFNGDNNWLFGKEIIATNGKVTEEFNKVITDFF